MGRTGRKRSGQVKILLTGNEYQKFKKSASEYKKLIKELKSGTNKIKFFDKNPAMIGVEKMTLQWEDLEPEEHVST